MVLRGEVFETEDMREGEKRERGREEWQTEAWEERIVPGKIYGGMRVPLFGCLFLAIRKGGRRRAEERLEECHPRGELIMYK